MLKIDKFPYIIYILTALCILGIVFTSITFSTGNTTLGVVLMIMTTVILLIESTLSITFANKLSHELFNVIEDNTPKFNINSDNIKVLGKACHILDKYNVHYSINFETCRIDAYVSMGLYTRMSVSNNLESIVNYHINGTNTILVKPTDS